MKQKPIFSVIIPAYNEEKYLPACLKPLVNQDFPREKYEVIVVDIVSIDKTPQIAKKFKVKLIKEPKKGLIRARQRVLKIAKGQYIAHTDADCLVPKNWLSTIFKHFTENKNIIAVAGPTFSTGQDFFSKFILKNFVFINCLSTKILFNSLGF